MEKKLLCLGEAWLELTAATVPELADTFHTQISGWGAEFSLQYAALGGTVQLLSQLGADPFGRKIAAHLASGNVDCTQLSFTAAARTPVVFSGNGESLAYRLPSSELLYAPEQLDCTIFADAFALCFSSVCLVDSPCRMTHLRAISFARDVGAFVCYAPRMAAASSFWQNKAFLRETALQFIQQADVLLLETSDLTALFGSKELRTALFPLFSGRVQMIFYTAADRVVLLTRNVMLSVPGCRQTAAGFLHSLCKMLTYPDQIYRFKETQLQQLLS